MNEIVAMVVQRTGMSQENAQKAVQAVIDVLKEKLPAPIASHIDSLLTGGVGGLGAEAGDMIKGALGGFFGKK